MTTYGEKFSAEEVKEMMSSAMDVDGKVCARAMRVYGWISDSLVACCRVFSSLRAWARESCTALKKYVAVPGQKQHDRSRMRRTLTGTHLLNMFCQVHYEDFAELLAAD